MFKLASCLAAVFILALTLTASPLAASPDHTAAPAEASAAVYIVHLQELPLVRSPRATWTAPRREGGARKLDLNAPASRAILDDLRMRQDEALGEIGRALGRPVESLHRYAVAFDGLAVELTPAEADALAWLPGVSRVQRGVRLHIASDAGPGWTGAPGIWDGTGTGGLPGTQGEGIVVGVIDTGIDLDHPSFADVGGDGFDHANPRGSGNYAGWCDPGNPDYDPTLHCNDKLIGVWSWPDEGGDPRDVQGHGTHTASIAAGNHITADVPGISLTRAISGVAPHANLISYDVCDNSGYCPSWILLEAVDQAVADGVDVISLAIAGYGYDPWYDSVALALLSARDAGVFVAAALGEYSGSIGSPANAPWLLGVGATSHNRRFASFLAGLSGGSNPPADLAGKSLTAAYGPAALVDAGQLGNYGCYSPFPAGTFHGEIVVCSHDPQWDSALAKGQNVLAAGGGGMVLAEYYSYGAEPEAAPNVLPWVLLKPAEGNALFNWLSTGSGHTGRISATTAQISSGFADRLWPFSPRSGPNYAYNFMKPNLVAPGREILAAHTDPGGYKLLSGTSMAAAHAAGAAALLTVLHPAWTPAEIQSALETTGAAVTYDDGSPAEADAVGGGRLALPDAARAGLVLAETTQHFQAADPNVNGDPRTLNLPGLEDNYCILTCAWTRTVRSTLAATSHWTVSVVAPAGVTVNVIPSSFTLSPGATQQLQVTANGSTSLAGWKYGRVVLTETGSLAPAAHLSIAAFFVQHHTLTVQKSGAGSGRVTSDPAGINCGSDCSEPYPEDTYVTLTAAADTGSVFAGWAGTCYGVQSTCQVGIYLDRTAIVYFGVPSPDRPLSNQTPLRDSLNGPVSRGTWNYYYADLGSGVGELVVDILDLTANADLYVRLGSKPTLDQADCVDYDYYGTPNRRCVITNPAAGRWWIGVVNGAEGISIGYSVRASWGTSVDRQLSNHSPVNDFVSSSAPGGGWKYYFFDLAAGSSDLFTTLTNLSADADLYLRRNAKPDRSNYDCASTEGSTVVERCSVASPGAGRWWLGVNNFSAGTVTYTVTANWQTSDAAADFYAVPPCRVLDTRTPTPQPLVSGVVRSVQVTGTCQIPAGARAISVNATVVGPSGRGMIVLYPGDEAPPATSTINFQAGQIRSNNALLKLAGNGTLGALATVQAAGQVHLVVDVNGYYQ